MKVLLRFVYVTNEIIYYFPFAGVPISFLIDNTPNFLDICIIT
jgi:hypothetical protein